MVVLVGLETAKSSFAVMTESGLDLIAPVPLDETSTTPPEAPQITAGQLAVEPAEGWTKGEAIAGRMELSLPAQE
jgi:hypothetical protein